jgi:predicted hydrolase (HD superfamily)
MVEILTSFSDPDFCLEVARDFKSLKYQKAGKPDNPLMNIKKAGDEAANELFPRYTSKEFLKKIVKDKNFEEHKIIYEKLADCLASVFPEKFKEIENDFEKGFGTEEEKLLVRVRKEKESKNTLIQTIKQNFKEKSHPGGP